MHKHQFCSYVLTVAYEPDTHSPAWQRVSVLCECVTYCHLIGQHNIGVSSGLSGVRDPSSSRDKLQKPYSNVKLYIKFWCFIERMFVFQCGFRLYFVKYKIFPISITNSIPHFPHLDYTVRPSFGLHIGSRPSDHYFHSACWFVCLSVCLCRVFLSRLWSDFDQTRTYVICLGLVVSPRIGL